MKKLVTIGAYGFDAEAFFQALRDHGVDTFCDVRARRGVRGAAYAFVNSRRLQERLRALGIRYLHLKELAPSATLRQQQDAADQECHVAKRRRSRLSDAFVAGYRRERLSGFRTGDFLEQLGPEAGTVALFCVEAEPSACHRSLLSECLESELAVEVIHITPPASAP